MTPKTDKLINLLATKEINYHDFLMNARNLDEINALIDSSDLKMWEVLGLSIERLKSGKVALKTKNLSLKDATFCVVDIETSGGLKTGQIIEIGAIKTKNGEILDKFETLVKAESVPENISELTGIFTSDLADAPPLKSALEKFKIFLGSAVFVAHNVRFDYDFISKSLEESGFGMLLNRRICTIELARRTIPSLKYGLGSLKELLGIQNCHHRAYSDAVSAFLIMKECFKNLPENVKSVEDLIEFSKTAKSLKITPNLTQKE